jgi:hypothetical protein
MMIFLGTTVVFVLCCLLMGLGLVFSGKPLSGGCGNKPPGSPRCEGCPGGKRTGRNARDLDGESAC